MEREVRTEKPSLKPMVGQAGCLQGLDLSAVTYPSSSHARRCLIQLSCDNRCTRYTAPLAEVWIHDCEIMRLIQTALLNRPPIVCNGIGDRQGSATRTSIRLCAPDIQLQMSGSTL
ncbi:hypothetical protein J6590_059433 [Homalodisca vitripennis]|nr:hypothetical protein J6590_059433 [Homalodisca vitripennis]